MISEVLDENGIEFYKSNKDYERFNNLMLSTKDSRELIAQQYVKENKFDLEWFNNPEIFMLHQGYLLGKKGGFEYECFWSFMMCHTRIGYFGFKEYKKTFAWLYANDIKINE